MDYPTIEEIAERMHALREMCGYTEKQIVAVAFAFTAVMCILTYFGIRVAL